jgi:hypothetical protein
VEVAWFGQVVGGEKLSVDACACGVVVANPWDGAFARKAADFRADDAWRDFKLPQG